MQEFARSMFLLSRTVIENCPDNAEREISIRKLYEALIYADLSLMLGNYDEDYGGTPPRRKY